VIGSAYRRVPIAYFGTRLRSWSVSGGTRHREDPHEIFYFQRHIDDDQSATIPAQEFLTRCPAGVRAKFFAVLVAVAVAPPHRFSGGGYWEAMHGEMKGWHEVRIDGPKPGGGKGRHHYRLFCQLDYEASGATKPWLVVITGMSKSIGTALSAGDYARVRQLGYEYRKRNPRSVA
jgi:hypothetical protein